MEKTASQQYVRRLKLLKELTFALQCLLIFGGWSLNLDGATKRFVSLLTSGYFLQIFIFWTILYIALNLVALPLRIAIFRLERGYGLIKLSFADWMISFLKVRAIVFFVGAAGLEWFYLALRVSPDRWWLLLWPAPVLYDVLMMFLLPTVLISWFYKVSPLDPGPLANRLAALLLRARIPERKLAVIQIKDISRRVMALVAGLGPTRRILLTDTMVAGYTEDEIEAVIAHEAGHEICHHVPKRIVVRAASFLLILSIGHFMLRLVKDPADITHLPMVMLCLFGGWAYGLILFAIVARRHEKAADRAGWALIEDVGAYISAMKKLGADNMIPGEYGGAGSYHPPTDRRIAAAEKFLAERTASVNPEAAMTVR